MGFATKDSRLLERAGLLDAKANYVRAWHGLKALSRDCTVNDQLD